VFSRLATFILEQLGAPRTSIYGTMVEVCGLGVLFEGDPGLGKSETALGLIKRGASLIADDLTCIRKDVATNLLFGSASESTAGYMEIRGIGIMHVPSVFGINAVRGEKRLQLVITFKKLRDIRGEVDRIGQTRMSRSILGVDVPNIIIPVSEGRDLVNLVETAAQQQKLVDAGYDPVMNLSERLHARANEKTAEKGKAKRKGKAHG
jgi:HPr kinase/phosphorylase